MTLYTDIVPGRTVYVDIVPDRRIYVDKVFPRGPKGDEGESGFAPPGCLVARSRNGTIVSDPVESTTAFIIDEAYEYDSSGLIGIRTRNPHGYATLDEITVRQGGMHARSWRRHPANGTWQVTVIDERNMVLSARTVAESENDIGAPSDWDIGGHSFVINGGICYKTLTDCRPEWQRLTEYLVDNGGGVLEVPPGIFAFKTLQLTGATIYLRSNIIIQGSGFATTHLFKDDFLNGFFLFAVPFGAETHGARNWGLRDLTVNGNRAWQTVDKGYHNVRGASNSDFFFENFWCVNAAGYGIGLQGDDTSAFFNVRAESVTLWDSDSDGWDTKNRTGTNRGFNINNLSIYGFAEGTRGTNNSERLLKPNALRTTSGSAHIRVEVDGRTGGSVVNYKALIGNPVTIWGATPFNGVDPNGTWLAVATVTNLSANVFSVDVGQTANATGNGGGSAIHYDNPFPSVGDVGYDSRALGNISNVFVFAPMKWGARGAIRARPDSQTIETHLGSNFVNWTNIWIENSDHEWASDFREEVPGIVERCDGIRPQGTMINVSNAVARYCAAAAAGYSQADFGSVVGIKAFNCYAGIWTQGDNLTYSHATLQDCEYGCIVEGVRIDVNGILQTNPFATTAGNPNITVTFANHGITDLPATVKFFNGSNANLPVTAAGSGNFRYEDLDIVAIPNADTLIVELPGDIAPPTSDSAATGGANLRIAYPSTLEFSDRIKFEDIKIVNPSIAGLSLTNMARGTRVKDCEIQDLPSGAVAYDDSGIDTDWMGGNIGLPNQNIVEHATNGNLAVTGAVDTVKLTGAITADRTLTLPSGQGEGDVVHIERVTTATGAFSWLIAGTSIALASAGTFQDVRWNGSVWEPAGKGSL